MQSATLCPVCGGHGADPLSDNSHPLPCYTCGGTGMQQATSTTTREAQDETLGVFVVARAQDSPESDALRYVLYRVIGDPNFRHIMLGTEAMERVCAAVGARLGMNGHDVDEAVRRMVGRHERKMRERHGPSAWVYNEPALAAKFRRLNRAKRELERLPLTAIDPVARRRLLELIDGDAGAWPDETECREQLDQFGKIEARPEPVTVDDSYLSLVVSPDAAWELLELLQAVRGISEGFTCGGKHSRELLEFSDQLAGQLGASVRESKRVALHPFEARVLRILIGRIGDDDWPDWQAPFTSSQVHEVYDLVQDEWSYVDQPSRSTVLAKLQTLEVVQQGSVPAVAHA